MSKIYQDIPLIHNSEIIIVPSQETVTYSYKYIPHSFSNDMNGVRYVEINGIWSNISNNLQLDNNAVYTLTSGEPEFDEVRFSVYKDSSNIYIIIYNDKQYDINCKLFFFYFGLRRQVNIETVAHKVQFNRVIQRLTTAYKVHGYKVTNLLTTAHKVSGLMGGQAGTLKLTSAWKVRGPATQRLTTTHKVQFNRMIQKSTVSYKIANKQFTKNTIGYKVSNTEFFKTTTGYRVLGTKSPTKLTATWKVLGPAIQRLTIGYKVAHHEDPIRLTIGYKVNNRFITHVTEAHRICSNKSILFKGLILDNNDLSKNQQYNLGNFVERFNICNNSIIAIGYGIPQVWSNDITPIQYEENVDYIWNNKMHTITRIPSGNIGVGESVDILYGMHLENTDDNIIIANDDYVPNIGIPVVKQLDDTILVADTHYTWNSETFNIIRKGVTLTATEHVKIIYGIDNKYEDIAIITYGHRLNHAPRFYNIELFSEDGFFLKFTVDYNYNLDSGNITFTDIGLNNWCE